MLQGCLGLELTALIEDPGNASVQHLAQEARAKMAAGEGGSGSSAAAAQERSIWISPTPVSVKMRLFCLPYAGGVSENVFARCAPYLELSHLWSCWNVYSCSLCRQHIVSYKPLSSLGREPVSVNGKHATDPVELFTGDQIT